MSTNLERTLRQIFSKHRWSILLTYGLTLLENFFELLHPLTVGIAINGLLKQDLCLELSAESRSSPVLSATVYSITRYWK
jgi:hypothetical protein